MASTAGRAGGAPVVEELPGGIVHAEAGTQYNVFKQTTRLHAGQGQGGSGLLD